MNKFFMMGVISFGSTALVATTIQASPKESYCDGIERLDRYFQVASCDAVTDNGVIKSLRILQCVDDEGKLQTNSLISYEQSDSRGWMNGKTFLKAVKITTSYSGDNVNGMHISGSRVDVLRGNEGFGSFDLKPEDNQLVKIAVLDAERTETEGKIDATTYSKPASFKCSHIKSLSDIFGN